MKKLAHIKVYEWIFYGVVLMSIVLILYWSDGVEGKMEHYFNTDITYVKGTVKEVDNSNLEKEKNVEERYTGLQKVEVLLESGKHKKETVYVDNYLTAGANIFVRVGQKVIVSQDEPEGSSPYFLIYNYNRQIGLWTLISLFAVIVILVGRMKGIKALLGLIFTLFLIVKLLIPMVYIGQSPIIASIITMIASTFVSLYLLNGFSKKTGVAVLSTIMGVLVVGIIFVIWGKLLQVSGFKTEEAEFMIMLSQKTKLQVGQVLFAGVLIASLGAVMDVGMSIASALYEITEVNNNVTKKELFKSGLNIGRDMIGTMSNTLILAFTGTGISTLLVLIVYGIKYHQFMNSDFLAIEVCRGISGTLAIVLMVPITSFIASSIYRKVK